MVVHRVPVDTGTGGHVCKRPLQFFAECLTYLDYYVRQVAWLSTPPEQKTAGRGNQAKEAKSRYETLRELDPDSPSLELPTVEGYAHLLTDITELGYCTSAGFGQAVLSYQEIYSWSCLTGTAVTAWEAVTLRRLSRAYCEQVARSKVAACPPPWTPVVEPTPELRDKVDSFFRVLAKRKSGGAA